MDQKLADMEILLRLLQGSGIMVREEVESAKSMAENLNIPILETIKRTGMLSDGNLQIALELQDRIIQRRLTFDVAIRAFRIALQKLVPIDEAIDNVNKLHEQTRIVVSATNDLTSLLLLAKHISSEDLGRLIKLSQDSSMMIGQLLVMDNKLTPDELISSLNAVLAIRGKKIVAAKAAQALRYARQKAYTFEAALYELGFMTWSEKPELKDRDLITMSNAITRDDLAECYEIEVLKQKEFSQILLERALVNAYQIQCTNGLISLVSKEKLKPYQAKEVLYRVCNEGKTFEDALNMISKKEAMQDIDLSLPDLLINAGVTSAHELSMALVGTAGQMSGPEQMNKLLAAKIVSQDSLIAALRVHSTIVNGYLTLAHGTEILRFCYTQNKSIDSAYSALGVYVPANAQWTWVR